MERTKNAGKQPTTTVNNNPNGKSQSIFLISEINIHREKTTMKTIFCIAVLILAIIHVQADPTDAKKPSAIQWWPVDCSSVLMLPKGQYDASHFGKGMYRIDNMKSRGHFNNIYIIFQAKGSLDPVSVPDAKTSTFVIKDRKVTWRSYHTVVEGKPVIRKEALMPNILPHKKEGRDSEFIWIRIDAYSQDIIDELTPAAEEIIRDCAG